MNKPRTMTEISLMERELSRARDDAWVRLHANLRAQLEAQGVPGPLTDVLGPAIRRATERAIEAMVLGTRRPTEAELAAMCREELVRAGVLKGASDG